MSTALEAYQAALRNFRICLHQAQAEVHNAAIADLRLDEPDAPVTAVTDANRALAFAARDLVQAVDDLPMDRQPKGWNTR